MRQLASSLIILFLSTFTFSCKDEQTISALVGTWTIVSAGSDCGGPNEIEPYPCDADNCTKFTFTADGKLIIDLHSGGVPYFIEGTYSVLGNRIALNYIFDGKPRTDNDTFVVTEDSLSMFRSIGGTYQSCTYTSVWSKN